MGSHHFNGESIIPGGLEDINATGLHGRPYLISMSARTSQIAHLTKLAPAGFHPFLGPAGLELSFLPKVLSIVKENIRWKTFDGQGEAENL